MMVGFHEKSAFLICSTLPKISFDELERKVYLASGEYAHVYSAYLEGEKVAERRAQNERLWVWRFRRALREEPAR